MRSCRAKLDRVEWIDVELNGSASDDAGKPRRVRPGRIGTSPENQADVTREIRLGSSGFYAFPLMFWGSWCSHAG
jgi:hypothetical protein